MVVQLCFDMTNCNIVPGLPDNSNSRTTKMLFKKYGSTKKEVVLNFSLTYYVYMYDCWTCCNVALQRCQSVPSLIACHVCVSLIFTIHLLHDLFLHCLNQTLYSIYIY
jgi:hypothetical protein